MNALTMYQASIFLGAISPEHGNQIELKEGEANAYKAGCERRDQWNRNDMRQLIKEYRARQHRGHA